MRKTKPGALFWSNVSDIKGRDLRCIVQFLRTSSSLNLPSNLWFCHQNYESLLMRHIGTVCRFPDSAVGGNESIF
ncbi:hypothetical protein NPIL_304091 [Nephila pilipes]|uniref:Uncharacterized protein n=1 Tax=Nephila pilipes TaxID=299642 RepID=A0A8X6TLF6_NEPPI|nr:hypothetical protein NPIL_304091 [Nephila pilipes]